MEDDIKQELNNLKEDIKHFYEEIERLKIVIDVLSKEYEKKVNELAITKKELYSLRGFFYD